MPKRIQLPSADALFAEPTPGSRERGSAAARGRSAPVPRGSTATTPAPAPATPTPAESARRLDPTAATTAGKPTARRARTESKPAARTAARVESKPHVTTRGSGTVPTTSSKRPSATTSHRSTAVRLQRLEARLSALPVETLLELRDELEGLLAAPELHVDEVDRLLATAGV